MFQAKVFVFNEIKTPQTEENLLYKMAQPLFRASRADFEFNLIHCFSGVFQANFTLKSTFWPLSTGSSSILTPDSSLKLNFSPRKYVKHLVIANNKCFWKSEIFRFSVLFSEKRKFRFYFIRAKHKCFLYFLGLKFDFKLESDVKIELDPVERGQNVDFGMKLA